MMEIALILIGLAWAYGLGRVHGARSIKRHVRRTARIFEENE